MKVVFCSHFSLDYLKPEVLLTDPNLSNHPASWIRVLAEQLALDPNVDLHVIVISTYIAKDHSFKKNNITFHLLEASVPKIIKWILPLSDQATLWIKPILKTLQKIRQIDPDIVHGHGTEAWFSIVSLLSGYPCVISLQGIISKIYESTPTLKYWIIRKFERHTISRAKYINPKTSLSMSLLDSFKSKATRFHIEAAIEKRYWSNTIPPFAKRMLFTGVLIRRKGIFEFVNAFVRLKKAFPELEAVVIGGGSDSIKEKLIQCCTDEGVVDSFVFTGQISFEKIKTIYKNGGIFCLSSYAENSPNCVMEAMAAGLPVVATDVGDVNNIVLEGISGFVVEKENSNELAEKIAVLLKNEEQYMSFGNAGKKIATNRWRPEIIAAKHIEMYQLIFAENA
jgi:glycosyltransferase involved in cell wall biosynthesis